MSLPTRQIGGHNAALNNPNVSEEAKEHSRQVIDELVQPEMPETRAGYEEEIRVVAGHKATLKNPNVSEQAKEHSRQFLEERDEL